MQEKQGEQGEREEREGREPEKRRAGARRAQEALALLEILLLNCQDLYLNQCAFGQILHCYGRAGREGLGEELSIHLVHGNEVGHVAEENCCLDNMGQVGSCCCQYLRGIGEHLSCLFLDATFYECSCGRVDGDLTTAEYHTICLYRLAVRADSGRCLVCTDYFHSCCFINNV